MSKDAATMSKGALRVRSCRSEISGATGGRLEKHLHRYLSEFDSAIPTVSRWH